MSPRPIAVGKRRVSAREGLCAIACEGTRDLRSRHEEKDDTRKKERRGATKELRRERAPESTLGSGTDSRRNRSIRDGAESGIPDAADRATKDMHHVADGRSAGLEQEETKK
jgi:hypothetical protein